MTDHIHAINQLKKKCREYNIPLCVAFVDYEKALDAVQLQATLTSLREVHWLVSYNGSCQVV